MSKLFITTTITTIASTTPKNIITKIATITTTVATVRIFFEFTPFGWWIFTTFVLATFSFIDAVHSSIIWIKFVHVCIYNNLENNNKIRNRPVMFSIIRMNADKKLGIGALYLFIFSINQ